MKVELSNTLNLSLVPLAATSTLRLQKFQGLPPRTQLSRFEVNYFTVSRTLYMPALDEQSPLSSVQLITVVMTTAQPVVQDSVLSVPQIQQPCGRQRQHVYSMDPLLVLRTFPVICSGPLCQEERKPKTKLSNYRQVGSL